MLKKLVATIVGLMLLFSNGVPVYANTVPAPGGETIELVEITPLWQNAFRVLVGLDINNGRAALTTQVVGQPGTTHITARVVLEQRNANGTYSLVNSWTNLSTQGMAFPDIMFWNAVHFIARGHWYRLTAHVTVYRNGFGEQVTMSISRFAH